MRLVNSGKLTLACADLDARPLFWTEPGGDRFGFEPGVAKSVAEKMGLGVKWEFLQWAEFAPALDRGRVDAIWCGCAITRKREKSLLFTRPYAVFNESLLVMENSPIRSPLDLKGLRVGAIAGSTNMALAETWPEVQCVGFDGQSDNVFLDMIQALARGTIEGVVDDEPAFLGLAQSGKFRIAFTVPTGNPWGGALSLDNIELKSAIDKALNEVCANGQMAAIWNDWLGTLPYPESLN